MKESFATIAREIAADARKDSARFKPALPFIVFGVAMAVVSFVIGGGTAQRIVEFAGCAALIIGVIVMVAPKGIIKAVTMVGAITAISGMAASSVILLNGGTVAPALERGVAWSILVAMIPHLIYITKTKIIDPRAEKQTAAAG